MRQAEPNRYLIALGSNRRHRQYGRPEKVLRHALEVLSTSFELERSSMVIASTPLGPSHRRYANAATLISSTLAPAAQLAALKRIERSFGRRYGQRWSQRVLDLDIILWSGGMFRSPDLHIPHPAFRARFFVVGPAAAIAPGWRDPVTNRTLRQLAHRATRAKPLDRGRHPL